MSKAKKLENTELPCHLSQTKKKWHPFCYRNNLCLQSLSVIFLFQDKNHRTPDWKIRIIKYQTGREHQRSPGPIFFFLQKRDPDKKTQHFVQLDVKSVQSCRIHTSLRRYSNCQLLLLRKVFLLCPTGVSPGVRSTHYPSSFPCDSL